MLGAVHDSFIAPRMKRPATDSRVHRASRPMLLLPVLLVLVSTAGTGSLSWAAKCNTTAPDRVENSTDILTLIKAVDCSDGGNVTTDWEGSIISIAESISIGSGTFLSITGNDEHAEIRGNGTRLFNVFDGGSLSLTRLNLSGGMADEGGAIQCYEADLTLDRCVFKGNNASTGHGGAVWAQGGQVTILGGTFSNNVATGFGGALFANNTDLTIQDSTFQENKAGVGGALYGNGLPSCSLHKITFVSNLASEHEDIDTRNDEDAFGAGGAAAFEDAEIDISDCLFDRNIAQLSGGAVFGGAAAVLTVNGSNFTSNTASVHGGAIAASSATLGMGTDLVFNYTKMDGGESGEVAISGGTFSNNSAKGFGGALFANITGLTIYNCTRFEDNEAVQGGAIYGKGLPSCSLRNATFISNNASYEVEVGTDRDGKAFEGGGAAAFHSSGVEILNCLFVRNAAQLSGGAVSAGTAAVLTVLGSTFSNNTASLHGGAITASSATLGGGTELVHNVAAMDGGAVMIWQQDGTIAFDDVLCLHNIAYNWGGCLFVEGNVTLADRTTMQGNVAEHGGCIYAATESNIRVDGGEYTCKANVNGGFLFASDAARVTINGTAASNNVATKRGGAIYCNADSNGLEGSQVTIEGATFSNNEAFEAGGAISARGRSTVVTIAGGTFERNKAEFNGGFIFLQEEASFSCEGGTISNNSAGDLGGGIYARVATWVNSSCGMIGNESPQGAAAYFTHVGAVTLHNSTIAENLASGGSVVFVAQSSVFAGTVTFASGIDALEESRNRAIQLNVNSSFLGQDCIFNGWLGDTVIYNANAANGSLVLDSCDFSGSSATMTVISPYSDAQIRNAMVGDKTLVNVASVYPLQLVDRAMECNNPNACGASGECVDSALGVLCECLPLHGEVSCLDDGGTLSLELQTILSNETDSPSPFSFELLVSAADDGTTSVIWNLTYEADNLNLTVVPLSGILPLGGNATVTVTGTPIQDNGSGIITSRFVLTSVGGGSSETMAGSTTDAATEIVVKSTFNFCSAYEYASLGLGDTGNFNMECKQCITIEGAAGVDCENEGATLAALPIREGYWRSSNESLVIHSCSHSEACAGATQVSSSDDYCADGYKGPYCAVCAEHFGRGAGNSCHSCTGSKSPVLIAAGAIFSAVTVIFVVFAVAFLVGGLDAINGMDLSLSHLASPSFTLSKPSRIHSSSGTEHNGGHGAPPPVSPQATQLFSPSGATEAGHSSGNHHEGVFSPSARMYPNVFASCDNDNECKNDDREVDGRVLKCQGSCSEPISTKADTTGVVCSRRADISPRCDALTPTNICSFAPSTMLGCSTGTAMVHTDSREAEAEDAEGTGGWNNGPFGCCRQFVEQIKKWTSRLHFDKLKILVVVWQILTIFPNITAVDFPPSYSRFLTCIDVVNLDLGQIFSASCLLPSVTFYERLLAITLAPIVLAGVLVFTYQVAKRKAGIGPRGVVARRAAWSRHMAAGLLLSFLVFTSTSTMVFQTFPCDTEAVDGESYLRADYRISCKSDQRTFFMAYARIMILVYPVGIPLLYFFLLWTNRRSLKPRVRVEQVKPADFDDFTDENFMERAGSDGKQSQQLTTAVSAELERELEKLVRKRRQNPALTASMFLWKDFGPDMYYYEVIECGRRILLTGVLVFIAPNSATQTASACIFAFVSLLVFEVLRPHVDRTDVWLYRMGCVVIFLSNFLALLIKMDAAGEDKRAAFAGLLVAINVFLVLTVLSVSWFATQQQVDDSSNKKKVSVMAKTMPTTEGLIAGSRRQLQAGKRTMPTKHRVSPAVGYVPANYNRFGGAPYAPPVGPTRLAIGGGHSISSTSVRDKESDGARGARASIQSGDGLLIVSQFAGRRPALMGGRQVIGDGNGKEVIRLSASGGNSYKRSGSEESAVVASVGPGPPPMSGRQGSSCRNVMEEASSLTRKRDCASVPGGTIRRALVRQKSQRWITMHPPIDELREMV